MKIRTLLLNLLPTAAMLYTGACSRPGPSHSPLATVPDAELPAFPGRTFAGIPAAPLLWQHEDASITLKLGPRRRDPDTGTFRTGSRYELTKTDTMVHAESVLAEDDLADTGSDLAPSVRLFYDPDAHRFLIHEEHSWSVDRVILFQPDEPRTRVRYLEVPRLPGGLPHLREYRILGMRHGRVYIEKNGLNYVFPVDALADQTILAYGFG